MVGLVVIPGEEHPEEGSGIFDGPESAREVRPDFSVLKLLLSAGYRSEEKPRASRSLQHRGRHGWLVLANRLLDNLLCQRR